MAVEWSAKRIQVMSSDASFYFLELCLRFTLVHSPSLLCNPSVSCNIRESLVFVVMAAGVRRNVQGVRGAWSDTHFFWMIVSFDGDVRSDVGVYLDKAQCHPSGKSLKQFIIFLPCLFIYIYDMMLTQPYLYHFLLFFLSSFSRSSLILLQSTNLSSNPCCILRFSTMLIVMFRDFLNSCPFFCLLGSFQHFCSILIRPQ